MASSNEWIDALRRRARALRPQRPPGEFPPGWSAWFTSMAERVGAVTGASAADIAGTLAAREPVGSAAPLPAVGRWRAFNALWRQQWQPVGRDERWLRITGYASSFLIHLVLMILLLWLALVRLAPPTTSAPEGNDAVQVEFLGEGTPADTGGGAAGAAGQQAAAAAEAPERPTAASAAPAPSTPPPTPTSEPEQVVQVVEIERTPTQPVGPQPLVVTEVAVPDTAFQLPPPTPPDLRPVQVTVAVPQLRAPVREARVADIPTPPVAVVVPVPVPPPPVPQPPAPAPPAPVALEVPEPVRAPTITAPTLRAPAARASQIQAPPTEALARDIPSPPVAPATPTPPSPAAPAAAAAATATPAVAASATAAGAASASGAAPASTASGTASQANAAAAGKGPTANAVPGAQPGPKRGDDWAASDRNRPGGQTGRSPGLYNADGRPNLAPGANAAAGGGLPPGTIRDDIVDLDHAGSWLKRKPNDFERTSLDKYWVPSESLLAEWVRKSIKEVLIPVPGTGKTVTCTVVLLMLGGGCGISDPNMQDVEATARPPPDIPFKRDLQEPPRPAPGTPR